MPIKYIGSKRQFVPLIVDVVEELAGPCTVLDLFSGTSRVGDALKRRNYRVLANDYLACGEAIARCYVEADGTAEQLRQARLLIEEFNRLPPSAGYFTDVFCEQSRYLQPKNGARVDAIRDAIARKDLDPELEAVMLVSLMEAADRVDSTTGVQMAYLKQWAPRASNDLELRLPEIAPRAKAGKGRAYRMDAAEAVEALEADIAYVDPPYNQHSYLGNYHVWESLVLWDKPEHYGVACKRVDCRDRKSDFNSKRRFRAAWERIVERVRATYLVVSFSDEGFIGRQEMEAILARRGEVLVIESDYKRYVGAQIGVFNPSGEKVGRVSHLRNKEYLYVVSPEPLAEAAVRAMREPGWSVAGCEGDLEARPGFEPAQVGEELRVSVVQDPHPLCQSQRVAHHDVGGREFAAQQVVTVLESRFDGLETDLGALPAVLDDGGNALGLGFQQAVVDHVAKRPRQARLREPRPLQEDGALGRAGGRLQAAFAVALQEIVDHRARLEHREEVAVLVEVGHRRHLADRVEPPPLGALPVVRLEVDRDDFVGQAELLAQPDDARRTGPRDVVDRDHRSAEGG